MRERIGKYHIVYSLAQGGMAGIYVGALSGPAGFEKLMAIKVIHPHLASQQAFARMFLDEARLAAMIQHPNVAQVHTAGDEDGLLYMVVELILGQDVRTLSRKMRDVGAHFSQYLAAYIVSQVCRGLHAAHELRDSKGDPLGLVHRDVSLRNILISNDGHVKLIDFGIAWAKERLSKTRSGVVKGKAAYMAPEQIRGETLDRRADVFSAGVVLYQMLTGTHPFPAKNDSEQMRKIIAAPLEPFAEAARNLDPELVSVVEKALSKDPKGRYADALKMAERLDDVCRAAKATGLGRQLEQLMNELFSKERKQHEARMRAFYEKRRRLPGAAAPSADLGSLELTGVTSPSKSIWKESYFRRKGGLIAVAVAVAVVGLYALKYKQTHRDVDGERGPREAAAREPIDISKADSPEAETETQTYFDALEDQGAAEAEVVLELHPPDAAVFLNGVSVENTGEITLPVDETEHLLVVKAPGYRESRRHFRVDARTYIKIDLVPVQEGADLERSKSRNFRDSLKNKRRNLLGNPYR